MSKGRQRTVMEHNFSKAPQANVQRSKFNRSHGYKTTLDAGPIYPILVDEVYPGDSVSCQLSALARLATLIHVPMDNMFLETFFFFVPNRLLWNNWEKFMGQQDTLGASTDFTVPQVTLIGAPAQEGTLYDYMGLPTAGTANKLINSLPLRAYNLIFRDWFRDENLVAAPPINTGDGPDSNGNYVLKNRGKRHDYFTSCLPWPQKDFGNPVLLPLGTAAPIQSTAAAGTGDDVIVGNLATPGQNWDLNSGVPTKLEFGDPNAGGTINLQADLTNATAATINELRQAFQIQKLQERDARGGTRYTEIIKSHFQVSSPDARLQRPEYLGGGRSGVHVTTIPQTGPTASDTQTNDTPQANISGYGVATVSGHGFSKGFVEHGWIIGLVNIRADLTYQRGLDKMWSRQTKLDYYWPAFQALGEQAVLNQEIWMDGIAAGVDEDVFGYQERFAELRYKNSQITGKFRSSVNGSLDAWHLSQDFTTRPVLNETFITEDPPIDRIIAVPGEPQFLLDCFFSYNWARPMPLYGVPGYIDHF